MQLPEKGRHIKEGSYDYHLTQDGRPAFTFRWQGTLFAGSKVEFVFATDVLRIGRIKDDVAKSLARSAGFFESSCNAGAAGLLISTVAGAVGAALTKTGDKKGFGVIYNNEDGKPGLFIAIAEPQIVDEIFNSVPSELHDEDPNSTAVSSPVN